MKIFLLVILVTIFTGCGGGSGDSSTEELTQTMTQISKAIQEGEITDSATGEPLVNVKVSIGESTTITDADGFYTLSDLTENEEAIVQFEKEGYLHCSTKIQIKSLSGDNTVSSNYLEYSMPSHAQQENYNSDIDKLIITSSNANIKLSASNYIAMDKTNYEGTITMSIAYQDVSTDIGKLVFPGTFEGINDNGITVPFISYGFIAIDLKDSNGNQLDISNDAIITFPSNIDSNKDTLPLWYYDYVQGVWIEEGFAQRQSDGSYQGTISHDGTWSLSEPIEAEPGIYRGRIVYTNGISVKDARVSLIGKNWVQKDLSTDADGMFEIEVPAGEEFQFKAYNYKWKYGVTYQGTLPAIASGEIVDNRI